jgi:hypothetical protein
LPFFTLFLIIDDSYGYRAGKSALDAIATTRERCWKYNWVLEFDIKGLFDFKAKHMFFSFDWDEVEVQDDINFVMQEYFPEQFFHPSSITKHQYYAQCHAIASHFGYRMWSKEFEPLLNNKSEQILVHYIRTQINTQTFQRY